LKESDRLPAFEVNPEEFDKLLQERILWDDELEQYTSHLNLPRLKLTYEDMLTNENDFLNSILDFIEVKRLAVQGRTLKNTSDDLREVILNFDDIRNLYANTRYGPMFDEVIV
jgi:hypothetical protein